MTRPDAVETFSNSLHAGYSDLNNVEMDVARILDSTGHLWARNPVNGGYSIPLLEKGESRRFFPDFLVWKDGAVFAIDPKGGFLLQTEAGKKLLAIRDENGRQRVYVRFITEGTWSAETLKQTGKPGVAVWRLSNSGQLRCTNHPTMTAAVAKALEPS